MKLRASQRQAGFTIVETLMGALASVIIGVGVFTILNTGTMLSARNLALNTTNTALRGALDRSENLIQQADSMPELIDTSGNVVTTGPAAGIRFDRYIGAPYVILISAAGLPSSTTSMTLKRSTNPLASPPLPTVGDVVRIDGETAVLRPRVSGVSTTPPDAQLIQNITVTLAASLGTTVSGSSTTLTSKLVRKVALIVMPNGGKRELRYYHSYDLTTNLNDTTKYSVLTDQVGMQSDDATPFSVVQIETKSFVNVSFRFSANKFDQLLMGKQSDQFNTFSRLDVQIRPKVNP